MFWFLLFSFGLACTIIGAILTERRKQRAMRKCHHESILEHYTDCALSDEEQELLADLMLRYHVQFGREIVMWQQLRQVVRAGLSPEWDVKQVP